MNDENIPETDEKLYVNFAKSKRQFKMEQQQKFIQEPTNIYIKWLRPNVTELEIKRIFEMYGAITSVCIKSNSVKNALNQANSQAPAPNMQLNFAFVNFLTADEAKQA